MIDLPISNQQFFLSSSALVFNQNEQTPTKPPMTLNLKQICITGNLFSITEAMATANEPEADIPIIYRKG